MCEEGTMQNLSDITFKNSETISNEFKNRYTHRISKNFIEIDPRFDFQINYVKILTTFDPLTDHIHADSYEIVYMYKGMQYYGIDGEDYYVSSGQFVISPPNVLHNSGFLPEDKSTFYYITINIGCLPDIFLSMPEEAIQMKKEFERISSQKNKVFDISDAEQMEKLFKRLMYLHENECDYRITKIRNVISEIMITTLESVKNIPVNDSNNEDMHDIIEYIDKNIEKNLTVEHLASVKNFSKSAFQEKFKRKIGMPVHEFVMRKKINTALIMLESGIYDKKNIWQKLSFSSEQYFITVFKKYTSMTPSQYLKKFEEEV